METLKMIRSLLPEHNVFGTYLREIHYTMPYLDHLNDDTFTQSVRFRIRGEDEETFLPSYDIDKLLRQRHNLTMGETCDAALTVNEPRAEFAFDATAVDDPETVIDEVETLIENYNEPPEDMPEDEHDTWPTVELADVSRPA